MATFANPLTLIFHIGKELLVNGVNIFEEIYGAVEFYRKGDFFNFGKNVGSAISLVLLKNSASKKINDAKAYDFLDGFCTESSANFDFDQQVLYNNIDGLGIMIYGPIEGNLKDFDTADNDIYTEQTMAIHEVSHSLLEGVNSLVAKKAMSVEVAQSL